MEMASELRARWEALCERLGLSEEACLRWWQTIFESCACPNVLHCLSAALAFPFVQADVKGHQTLALSTCWLKAAS